MATINLGKIRLNWRGTWSSATAYTVNDAVYLNGDSFVAVADNTNAQPLAAGVLNANWNYLSRGASSVVTTRGDIVYRGASGLTRLAAGTAGQVLTTQGTTGDPYWQDKSGRPNYSVYTGAVSVLNNASQYGRQDAGYAIGGLMMNNHGSNPGYGNLFMITQDRKNIKSAGYQWYQNLGTGHFTDQISSATYPGSRATTGQYCQFDTALDADEYFAYVVRNYASAVAVTTKGRLYFTGYNAYGQFGFGDTTTRQIFTRSAYFGPSTGRTAVDVKIGKIFSGSDGLTTPFLVRTSEGEMYGAGYNGAGLLGQGDTTNRTSWTRIGAATLNSGGATITGFQFSNKCSINNAIIIAWNSAGQIFGWGAPTRNQLGLNTTAQQNTPQRLTQLESLIGAGVTPVDICMPVGGNDNNGVVTAILMTNGEIYTAGQSLHGQLGIGGADGQTSAIWQIATKPVGKTWSRLWASGGEAATFYALTTDGLLYSWGYNGYRQIGDTTTSNRQVPTLVSGLPAGFQGNIESVWTWGDANTSPTGFHTTWVRTTTNRWASFGYYGFGTIAQAQIPISTLFDGSNGSSDPREITAQLPDFGTNIVNIVPGYQTGSTSSAIYILMNDGRVFHMGYDDSNLWSGTNDGTNVLSRIFYPRQVTHF